jgi:hypothetical protein
MRLFATCRTFPCKVCLCPKLRAQSRRCAWGSEPRDKMNRPGIAVLPYPLQRALMRNLAVPAQQAGQGEFLALWAGQSAGIAQYSDVATLLQSLVNGVSEKLA